MSDMVPCPECNGRGRVRCYVPSGWFETCYLCGGRGETLSVEAAEKAYREAPEVPLPKELIDEIVEYVLKGGK